MYYIVETEEELEELANQLPGISVEEKEVDKNGRISGLSDYKYQKVQVMVFEGER